MTTYYTYQATPQDIAHMKLESSAGPIPGFCIGKNWGLILLVLGGLGLAIDSKNKWHLVTLGIGAYEYLVCPP